MIDHNYPDNRIISKRIILKSDKHYRTGKVRETINGIAQSYLPYKLEIMSYPDEDSDGFYLMSMSMDNQDVNDTWHPSLQDALEQALYEYNVQVDDWEDV